MNASQLKRANEIQEEIAMLYKHEEEIKEIMNSDTGFKLTISESDRNPCKQYLSEELQPMSTKNFIMLYSVALNNRIASLETEFNNL